MHPVPTRPPVAAPPRGRVGRALGAAVLAGLVTGALTSFGQGVLPGGFASLANAVAPWLVVPFVAGAAVRRWGWALVAGVLACAAQVAGYYLTAHLRGYAVGASWSVFWLVSAVPAGLVAGVAGWSWWRGGDAAARLPWAGRERGLGAAVLVAAWLAEAVVGYGLRLGYPAHAAVHTTAGVVAFALLGLRGRQHVRTLVWLGPALVLAGAGFAALGAV